MGLYSGLYLDCKNGTIQYGSECISDKEYTNIMISKSLIGGFFLGISCFAMILSIVCFVIFKARKSKERALFGISIASSIILFISLIAYEISQ